MGKNKVVEWYCVSCDKIAIPKQVLVQGPNGVIAVEVRPKTCLECGEHLQRHVTRVRG